MLCFRILLHLYPRAERRRDGAAMLEVLELRAGDAARGGRRTLWRFVARESAGLIRAAATARRRPTPESLPRRIASSAMALFADVRYALRSLRRQPGFAALVLTTIALGVGANTAIFTIVNAVLVQPLPYAEPERLVRIWPGESVTKAIYARLQQDARAYEQLGVWTGWGFTITQVDSPVMVSGGLVSVNHFDLLGVRPALGRAFVAADAVPGNDDIAVLSHELWANRFGADPEIVGKRVTISNRQQASRVVIGVMPPDYRPISSSWQLWVPITMDPTDDEDYYGSFYLQGMGRLAPGIDAAAATTELETIIARLRGEEQYYLFDKEGAVAPRVVDFREHTVGDVRQTLGVLLGGALLVLLVACVNVANLLLARSSERQREMAVRSALGAGRGRIVRQMITESLVLGLAGGVLGMAVAAAAVNSLSALVADALPRVASVRFDPTVLAFGLGVALLASVLFGLVPVFKGVGTDVRGTLADSSRGQMGSRRVARLHAGLVIAEVALSAVLVIGAGLLLKSLASLWQAPAGFDYHNVYAVSAQAPQSGAEDTGNQVAFWQQVIERVEATPGVESAGAIHLLPLQLGNWSFPILPEGFVAQEGVALPSVNFRVVTPGYFETMSIDVLDGRTIDSTDQVDTAGVVVVNRALADRFWPGESAVGKSLQQFGSIELEVVGVVENVRQHELGRDAVMEMYRAHSQWTLAGMALAVRTDGSPGAISAALAALRSDAQTPVAEVRSMEEVMGVSLQRQSISAWLVSAYGLLALLLGAVGVYGVTSYAVTRRTGEIGLRIALGARPRQVTRAVVMQGLVPVFAGIGLGLVVAAMSSRVVSALLYGVDAHDIGVYAGVSVVLALTALAAAATPARRAARVDPITALRAD